MDWLDALDGRIQYEQRGPQRLVASVEAPWTRIDADAFSALGEIKSLRSLSLSGAHFPTSVVEAPQIRSLAPGGKCSRLAFHGAALLATELESLRDMARSLASLDVAGLALSEQLLERIDRISSRPSRTDAWTFVQERGASFHACPSFRPYSEEATAFEAARMSRLERYPDH